MGDGLTFKAGRRLPLEKVAMPQLAGRDVGYMVDFGEIKVRIIPVYDARTETSEFRIDVFG